MVICFDEASKPLKVNTELKLFLFPIYWFPDSLWILPSVPGVSWVSTHYCQEAHWSEVCSTGKTCFMTTRLHFYTSSNTEKVLNKVVMSEGAYLISGLF